MEQLETDQMHQVTFFITTPSRFNQKQTFTNILAMKRIREKREGFGNEGRGEREECVSYKNSSLNRMYIGGVNGR